MHLTPLATTRSVEGWKTFPRHFLDLRSGFPPKRLVENTCFTSGGRMVSSVRDAVWGSLAYKQRSVPLWQLRLSRFSDGGHHLSGHQETPCGCGLGRCGTSRVRDKVSVHWESSKSWALAAIGRLGCGYTSCAPPWSVLGETIFQAP